MAAPTGSKMDQTSPQVLTSSSPTSHNQTTPPNNPIDIFRSHISDLLSKLAGVEAGRIFPALAWTNTLDKGDLILAVPRLQIKGIIASQKATEWAENFPSSPLVHQPKAIGISLRFDFKSEILPSLVLPTVFSQGRSFGFNDQIGLRDASDASQGRKKIIIEFSSPNIAKEFHVGHLRSTIIGAFLSNLYEGLGWDVTRMNYLGDWGRQFGLLAIAWERYGDEEAFQVDPISHLFEIYVKINVDFKPEDDAYKAARKRGENTSELENQGLLGLAKDYFKRMEAGDPKSLALWRRFREVSIEKYKTTYARLNISFAEYSGESTVKPEVMEEAERVLHEKGISQYDEGATIVDFKNHGAKKLEVAVIRNRNGTSNYLLRDIGAAIQRSREFGMDEMVYVIMSEQDVHVQRFFKILELMGGEYAELSRKLKHVTFGKISGMSTRKGTVKFLNDVLNDVAAAMHETMRKNEKKYAQVQNPDKVSDILGISSIMVQDMHGKRINAYNFDLDRMLSFEGDTGPYLQYAHARLASIWRKTGLKSEDLLSADYSLLKEQHATDVVRLIASYPDVVLHTYRTLEPAGIVTYLFKLTHQISSSYDVLQVVGAREGPPTTLARAALYEAGRQVLGNGMCLLGMSPVDRM
ncbi:hypothetical protein BGZ60DRAFT_222237 [Tricladium varicosporioides]|nr:hypothetical protein BGZ60DRAFT_222237 [Hymenoscyphus varicosporioides]